MKVEILVTDDYEQWFLNLSEGEQVAILTIVEVLEQLGPKLKRPYSGTINTSREPQTNIKNLKALRIQYSDKPYRVFYIFTPDRKCILLCGGRKDGASDKRFYSQMIKRAQFLVNQYLIQTGAKQRK